MKRMTSVSAKGLGMTRQRGLESLKAWTGISAFDKEDHAVAVWYEDNRKEVSAKLESLKADGVAYDVAALLRGHKEGGLKGVKQVLQMLPAAEREEVLNYLRSQ